MILRAFSNSCAKCLSSLLELIACLARALKGLANNCSEGEYYMRLEVKSFEMVRPTVW